MQHSFVTFVVACQTNHAGCSKPGQVNGKLEHALWYIRPYGGTNLYDVSSATNAATTEGTTLLDLIDEVIGGHHPRFLNDIKLNTMK